MVQDYGRKNIKGVGVGTLLTQNITLLTKWWWRLKNKHKLLWVEVIDNIHNLKSYPSNYLCSKCASRVWGNMNKVIKSLSNQNIEQNYIFSLVPGFNIKMLFGKIPSVVTPLYNHVFHYCTKWNQFKYASFWIV